MADIAVTATSVLAGSDAIIEHGRAGATIAAGQVVYFESSTGKLKLADCDGATAEIKTPYGIALHGSSDGQPLTIIKSGDLTLNAVLTAGARYFLSATAGGIAPEADMTGAGKTVNLLGIAKSTTVLQMRIQIPGVTL